DDFRSIASSEEGEPGVTSTEEVVARGVQGGDRHGEYLASAEGLTPREVEESSSPSPCGVEHTPQDVEVASSARHTPWPADVSGLVVQQGAIGVVEVVGSHGGGRQRMCHRQGGDGHEEKEAGSRQFH